MEAKREGDFGHRDHRFNRTRKRLTYQRQRSASSTCSVQARPTSRNMPLGLLDERNNVEGGGGVPDREVLVARCTRSDHSCTPQRS